MPSKEPNLKDIEERLGGIENKLKQQGAETALGTWRTIAIFGSSIVMVGVSLWIGRTASSPSTFMTEYAFLLVCGFAMMAYALRHYLKIKRKS